MGIKVLRDDHQLGCGHSPVDFLNEDPGPDGVGHTAEGRPLVLPPHVLLLLGEGRGQPLPHLIRDGLTFELRQIIRNALTLNKISLRLQE